MNAPDAALTAILGPTNTGKTHLAVERMTAHSSGMIGFPLRLLAREVYEKIVRIKGEAQAALITGEERIEPPTARYYCCTVESMPIENDFAFVAIDEAQLSADPERGHIFTDRLLHARGREETMILGSESLRPVIKRLLPEAELTTRPRFSTLSYAGATKLSRLPKRSAIVAFSVEQVYAVAEMLRRMRGGCAVVMGALSPKTRNAQVDMFQAGEVDYIVATDAIGMGLNLDVRHVAFAALHKFDGKRRRRLTVAEMAQIAGRAGRHHRDGTFGVLAGEGFEFEPEEVERIENHNFAPLDWLYWREAEPRYDRLSTLIADLQEWPREDGLRAAPQALDLEVLQRLSDMPNVTRLLRGPRSIARLWDAARLPDFRKLGAEAHSRFVASLWQYLGQYLGQNEGARWGVIPHKVIAAELARLDNKQGDVDTLSGRISATRSWTYIAHRSDWTANPAEMAQRARAVEGKLSDALHSALRQRFVDRRTVKLMRGAASDSALLPVEITDDCRVLVDDEDIGRLEGFAFLVDAGVKTLDRKLLLAAAERHLVHLLRARAEKVAMAEDSEFTLAADSEGRPVVMWQQAPLGVVAKGRSLMEPVFDPVKAVAGLDGEPLNQIVTRAQAWIASSLEKHMGGIVALNSLAQDEKADAPVRALAAQLADAGGIASRQYLAEAIRALPKESRGSARKGGIVFGAMDVFHHQAMKPAAAKWRMALFAAWHGNPMGDLPPESAVHLKDWKFAHPADARNAGYRKVGDEYLRIDLAERIVKKAHDARGDAKTFTMDMAFATSLGVSANGLARLMRDAGFRKASAAETVAEPTTESTIVPEPAADTPDTSPAVAMPDAAVAPAIATATATETAPANEPAAAEAQNTNTDTDTGAATDTNDDTATTQPPQYWRWVGLVKTRANRAPRKNHAPQKKDGGNKKPNQGRSNRQDKPAGKPPSELALQLAALTGTSSKGRKE